MTKKTKLGEKDTRIPDITDLIHTDAITQYVQAIDSCNTEQARSHRFSMLLQAIFGNEVNFADLYTSGIEKSLSVNQKDIVLRGRADNLYGNILIEFERNIPKKLDEAEGQLRQYTAMLWSQEPADSRRKYICIATDGLHFISYTPVLKSSNIINISGSDITLLKIEEADWSALTPTEIYYWLDRYLMRKAILHPSSEDIVRDFGLNSHAFKVSSSTLLSVWQSVKKESEFDVIYDSWRKYLSIVYGSELTDDQLFIRHTYLSTLAKLMAWSRLNESVSLPDERQIIELLDGRLFKAQGIENFIEEDFFSWIERPLTAPPCIKIVRWLYSIFQNYNLRELSEDVLKSLYQELVDPETRHDLGEFYTPDWLAHMIVNKLLDSNPEGSFLDPSCGSGTFLYLTIREKRARLGNTQKTLTQIVKSVYGIDIHPLAVIIAKTNYILALGDLLKKRKASITIPVYLADAIRLPEREAKISLWMQLPSYRIKLDKTDVYLPEMLFDNLSLYDQSIELVREFAEINKGRKINIKQFTNYLSAQGYSEIKNEQFIQTLFSISEILKNFIDARRDSIWAFILKNSYKPLFLKRKFDFIMGNPPWISLRYMEPAYQDYLKKQIVDEYKLLRGHGELVTHIELAALFLARCADLYLKSGGTIAFVLPKSIFSSDQHDGLRRRTFIFSEDELKNLQWKEIWDCEHISPLFNVPSCVLMAEKGDFPEIKYPVRGLILGGHLKRKNSSLKQSEQQLTRKIEDFSLHIRGKRSYWAPGEASKQQIASYYKSRFFQGTTIVPRSFWFVKIKSSQLGFNPDLPLLETADRALAEAKDAYKSVYFNDRVESHFLYATLLSTDLLPFGHLDYRLMVLPIERGDGKYRLIDSKEARKQGYLHLAQWLEKVESEWTQRRSSKATNSSALAWLNYRNKLTDQNPDAKYRVLYNTSGTFLTAAVIENSSISYDISGQQITTQ